MLLGLAFLTYYVIYSMLVVVTFVLLLVTRILYPKNTIRVNKCTLIAYTKLKGNVLAVDILRLD
jgi:hypothetical protein